MNKLYKCIITYTYKGDSEERTLLCYVKDSTWVNTCIPGEWRFSKMSYAIDYNTFILRKTSAIVPHEQNTRVKSVGYVRI